MGLKGRSCIKSASFRLGPKFAGEVDTRPFSVPLRQLGLSKSSFILTLNTQFFRIQDAKYENHQRNSFGWCRFEALASVPQVATEAILADF